MSLKSKKRISWPADPKKAVEVQRTLSARVSLQRTFKSVKDVRTVIGCDVGYSSNGLTAYAAAVAMELPSLKIIKKITIHHTDKKRFPYVPGLLSFREGPALERVLDALGLEADAYLFDGHGIAHPRRMGIAAHMGVLLNKPSVGCGKSLLYGRFEEPPPGLRGAYTFLKDTSDDIIGIVLRTKPYVKPIFVSPGHMMDFDFAGDLVMACTTKYRLPEPTRWADREAVKKP